MNFLLIILLTGFFTISASASGWLPVKASELAKEVDQLIHFLVLISSIASILVIAGFVYFAFKFRRKSETEKTPHITHNFLLEFLWSFIPFLIFMFVFGWGWLLYYKMRKAPDNALEIHVYGQMWNWDFVYKNGRKSSGVLYVPKDQPVKLIMTSRDVIHSFYIPSFRIKQDVLPGAYTSLHFTANKLGLFHVFCTEFCGTGHSSMLAKVQVMELKEWEEWLETDPYKGMSLIQIGENVFQKRCMVCHQTTKEKRIGPGMQGVFGSVRQFTDGSSAKADENYIRTSILNPAEKLVKGYGNLMTPFAGLLQEEELTGLIEYIKTLSDNENQENLKKGIKQ